MAARLFRSWIWAGLILAVAVLRTEAVQAQQKNTCVECHVQAPDPTLADPVRQIQGDTHSRRGLSCANCHGGDPNESDPERAMDRRKGFVGAPARKDIPAFCGKCHSDAAEMKKYNPALRVDQVAEYATSVHGKLLAKGDAKVPTCVTCHSAHGIQPVNDPNAPVYRTKVADACGKCHGDAEYMKPYSIPTDQLAKYRASVHAEALYKKQDLSAPTCNNCHGNHGAAPPGVASVANVCGACHSRQSDLFQTSPHKDVFEAMDAGQCLVCHSNHEVRHPDDEMLGVGPKAVCVKCHSQGDAGFEGAQAMRKSIDELATDAEKGRALLDRAAKAGMEVSPAKFDLTGAQDKLIDARVVIHAFSADALAKVTKPGVDIATKANKEGEDALQELQFRREGLAASLIFIVAAILSIRAKLRQIERRERKTID